MLALVENAGAYPEFVPYVHHVDVRSNTSEALEAEVVVKWKGLKKSFVTKNTKPDNDSLNMSLIAGPFKHLEGCWQIERLADQGCKVILEVHYQFKSAILGAMFSKVLTNASDEIIKAFSRRAKELYG